MSSTSNSNSARWAPYVLIVILLIVLFFVKKRDQNPSPVNDTHVRTNKVVVDDNPVTNNNDDNGLDRHPSAIHYSKHARCRMECRHIDETEVQEILAMGSINLKKSELDGEVCRRKFAVEGTTHDNQRVRIIFAPCNHIETVVTVIDLGKEWSCNCE